MDQELRNAARRAKGFMPEDEGLALHAAALGAPAGAPMLEVGSYCGKSAIYLGAAARTKDTVLYSVDHHRGSEEHQPGQDYHDPDLVDPVTGVVDTLPCFRRTIGAAGLEHHVVGIVGASATIGAHWSTRLSLVFIDGGHSEEAAADDYRAWAPHIAAGGILAIHDVHPGGPHEGGQAPLHIYRRALASGGFEETGCVGTLRLLRRFDDAG